LLEHWEGNGLVFQISPRRPNRFREIDHLRGSRFFVSARTTEAYSAFKKLFARSVGVSLAHIGEKRELVRKIHPKPLYEAGSPPWKVCLAPGSGASLLDKSGIRARRWRVCGLQSAVDERRHSWNLSRRRKGSRNPVAAALFLTRRSSRVLWPERRTGDSQKRMTLDAVSQLLLWFGVLRATMHRPYSVSAP